jgi:hypothetical protein
MEKKIKIEIKSKCLICFDTGYYFDEEDLDIPIKCDHNQDKRNLGLISDEKIDEEYPFNEDLDEDNN